MTSQGKFFGITSNLSPAHHSRASLLKAYADATSATLLGYWPFVDTLYDVSTNARGPATIQGDNVSLQRADNTGHVQIRTPGFLNIPAVDLRTTSFAVEFSLRLPAAPQTRQVLLSNWQQGNWQYLMQIGTDGKMTFTLRRDMSTSGSNPTQDLVGVTTAAPVPVGTFFDVVYVFDTVKRKLSVWIDGVMSAEAVVRQEFTDLKLHAASQSVVQFGNKGDDSPVTGQLNADLKQLRFYQLTF